MKIILVLAFIATVKLATAENCCPQPENADRCDCCPDACCCVCTNITVPGATAAPTTTPSSQTTTTSEICTLGGLDVVIIVDESASVTLGGWMLAMEFLSEMVASSVWDEVGVKTRFAFVSYNTTSAIEWRIDDPISDSVASLQAAFQAVVYDGGFTNTGDGLLEGADVLAGAGDRDDAIYPDIALVLSDGKRNEGPELNEGPIAALEAASSLIYVIGIGLQVDPAELEMISDNIFLVADGFGALADELENIVTDLRVRLCETINADRTTTLTPPMTTTIPSMVIEDCKCCCPPHPAKKEKCGCS